MSIRLQILPACLALFTLLACKKSADQSPVNPGGNQGNYSGQKLVLSSVEKVASPWVELDENFVYTSGNIGSALFKLIPAGFENKINSFYLPKGYMVVFAANSDGTGESACFVASASPVKANLPARLRNNISYIRYMKINNPNKKGTASTSDGALQALGSAWHYTWGINRSSFPGQQFVPMTWGKNACTDNNVNYLIDRNDIDHLLSFNEPDNVSQSNVPADTAINRYKIMQRSGLRLGSPVVTQEEVTGTGNWLPAFMTKAQAQRLRIDYIAVHWYDWGNENNNAATDSLTAERVFNRFVTYIGRVRQAYPNYPIWVTEFNANVNRSSPVVQKYFMKLSTDWMNTKTYIERYAYFFETNFPPVNPDNTLTGAGAYWKSLSSPPAFSANITGDAVLVN